MIPFEDLTLIVAFSAILVTLGFVVPYPTSLGVAASGAFGWWLGWRRRP